MKKHFSTILLVLILIIGLSLLLYPSFADWWNSFHQSRAIADYDRILSEMSPVDYSHLFDAADSYNDKLRYVDFPLMHHDKVPGYEDILDITGTGIMGYIDIPKINIELPIYHGTSEGVLQIAVGHIQGTTLPVGGENTHCALSAHRGLPSARLFTDLDKLQVGDIFTLTIVDRVLTYEVDHIKIVLPYETDDLMIVEGEDLCTLVTCTPYGVNTHRMLVRGKRIDNPETAAAIRVPADAIQIEPLIVAPVLAAPMLLTFFLSVMLPKTRKRNEEEMFPVES